MLFLQLAYDRAGDTLLAPPFANGDGGQLLRSIAMRFNLANADDLLLITDGDNKARPVQAEGIDAGVADQLLNQRLLRFLRWA